MNPTNYIMNAAAAIGLLCITVLAALGKIDGPTAINAIEWILGPFMGATALHGAAQHFAQRGSPAFAAPDPQRAAQNARLAQFERELAAMKGDSK